MKWLWTEEWTAANFCRHRIRLTRFLRISAANIGPNLFHQNRTVSWLISMPRSCRRSSTLRSESGKRTYSITAKRMISGLVLKYLNGECFVICGFYKYTLLASTEFNLTVPSPRLSPLWLTIPAFSATRPHACASLQTCLIWRLVTRQFAC